MYQLRLAALAVALIAASGCAATAPPLAASSGSTPAETNGSAAAPSGTATQTTGTAGAAPTGTTGAVSIQQPGSEGATGPARSLTGQELKDALAAVIPAGRDATLADRLYQGLTASKPNLRLQTVGVDSHGEIHPEAGVDVVNVKVADSGITDVIVPDDIPVVLLSGDGTARVTRKAASSGLGFKLTTTNIPISVCIGQTPVVDLKLGEPNGDVAANAIGFTAFGGYQAWVALGKDLLMNSTNDTTKPATFFLAESGSATVNLGFGPNVVVSNGGNDTIIGPTGDGPGDCPSFETSRLPIVVALAGTQDGRSTITFTGRRTIPYSVTQLVPTEKETIFRARPLPNDKDLQSTAPQHLELTNIETVDVWERKQDFTKLRRAIVHQMFHPEPQLVSIMFAKTQAGTWTSNSSADDAAPSTVGQISPLGLQYLSDRFRLRGSDAFVPDDSKLVETEFEALRSVHAKNKYANNFIGGDINLGTALISDLLVAGRAFSNGSCDDVLCNGKFFAMKTGGCYNDNDSKLIFDRTRTLNLAQFNGGPGNITTGLVNPLVYLFK